MSNTATAATTGPTVTKETAEVYKFRNLPQLGWADITISSVGPAHGRIQIASDYGDFQYFWSHCGMPFKKFLGKIGIEYAASKFRQDSWFDHEGTMKRFREDAAQSRREGSLSREKFKEIRRELKWLEDEHHESGFNLALAQCPAIMRYYDHIPDFRYTITPQFRYFWKTVWPLLLAEFEKEEASS